MVTTFHKTKSGPGLLAKIEANHVWEAFDILKSMLSNYYARHGAVLEDKEYAAQQIKNGKPTWILALVYRGKTNGRIQIQYLGESHPHKLWKTWTSQNFLVYFNFGKEETGITRRDRFKHAIEAF